MVRPTLTLFLALAALASGLVVPARAQETPTATPAPATPAPAPTPPAATTPALAQDAILTGTVTYRTRNLPPPTARVIVQLVDVARADAPAVLINQQVIETRGAGPPYAFGLMYDPAAIDPRAIYAVQAEIRDGDRLLFRSTRRIPVVTGGAPTSGVEVLVEPVAAQPTGAPQRVTIDSPPENTLVGSPVTVAGRAARYPAGGVLSYRFRDEGGQLLGSGDLPVGGVFSGPASFNASLSFTLPPQGGPVRLEIFERSAAGRELGLAARGLYVARPQAIRITTPAPESVVGSPVTVEGELGRLPSGARLGYTILASDGRQIGQGSFAVPGEPGRPALFRAALPFEASPEGDRIQVQLVDQDQASGSVIAQASVTLGVAPKPQQILVDSPAADTYVGTPLVLTGRTVRFPPSGNLGYAIFDAVGAQLGGGVFPVAGSLAVGGSFSASLGFSYPPQGGPIRVDLYDQDPATGQFRATASLTLRTVPLQQQIVIETPAPGTQVGVPAVVTGRTARYPAGGTLQYRVTGQDGALLGTGSFAVQGPFGEPARFTASLNFNPPAFSGPLRVEVFEADQFGNVAAAAAVELRWATTAPSQRAIVIETPAAGTQVGSPVTVTGRATFFPFEGTLSYRVTDSARNELGGGVAQARPEAGGARFVISIPFRPLPGGGAIVVEVFAVDQATGAVIATDSVRLRQAP